VSSSPEVREHERRLREPEPHRPRA
jgi:hypothetical protein